MGIFQEGQEISQDFPQGFGALVSEEMQKANGWFSPLDSNSNITFEWTEFFLKANASQRFLEN